MTQVSIHEAKTHLSRLLRRVAAGEEIIIAKSGRPIAVLAAIAPARQRQLGCDKGLFTIPDDFDEELPDAVLQDFE